MLAAMVTITSSSSSTEEVPAETSSSAEAPVETIWDAVDPVAREIGAETVA